MGSMVMAKEATTHLRIVFSRVLMPPRARGIYHVRSAPLGEQKHACGMHLPGCLAALLRRQRQLESPQALLSIDRLHQGRLLIAELQAVNPEQSLGSLELTLTPQKRCKAAREMHAAGVLLLAQGAERT